MIEKQMETLSSKEEEIVEIVESTCVPCRLQRSYIPNQPPIISVTMTSLCDSERADMNGQCCTSPLVVGGAHCNTIASHMRST